MLAGNVTLEEELAKKREVATHTTINGRPALLELDPRAQDVCRYVLRTDFGIVGFSRLYYRDHTDPISSEQRCGGLEELVSTIEPYLDH